MNRWDANAIIALSIIHPASKDSTSFAGIKAHPIGRVRILATELLKGEFYVKYNARVTSKWTHWRNRSDARRLRAIASILARTLNEQESKDVL